MADYGTAVAFGFLIAGAIPLWDVFTLSVEDRMENTLWTMFVVMIGIVVSIAVEYVFRRVHPTTDLTEGIEGRLKTVELVLRDVAEQRPLDPDTEKKITLYSTVGTSRLRRLIIRSDYGPHFKTQMTAMIALLAAWSIPQVAFASRSRSAARLPQSIPPIAHVAAVLPIRLQTWPTIWRGSKILPNSICPAHLGHRVCLSRLDGDDRCHGSQGL